MVNTVFPPNYEIPDCYYRWDNNHAAVSVRSRHPGGANVLMLDGSVHFISDSINERVWWALGSMAGGETVDNSQF
jgi:prepilin-type processing-associated H-X9-DG protein